MTDQNKPLSVVEQLKQKALQQKRESFVEQAAGAQLVSCPNCGAGRAKNDGLTQCAYCGFTFIAQTLTDGIYIKKTDNSK